MNFGIMQQIVAAGYDLVVDRYATWAERIYSPERETSHQVDPGPGAYRVPRARAGVRER